MPPNILVGIGWLGRTLEEVTTKANREGGGGLGLREAPQDPTMSFSIKSTNHKMDRASGLCTLDWL